MKRRLASGVVILAIAFVGASAWSEPLSVLAASNVSNAPFADCDDTNPSIGPGMAEVASNGFDDNCNGLADEDANGMPSIDPSDQDGDSVSIAAGDCNDHNPTVHIGAIELPGDFVDNDCNGLADDVAAIPSTDTVDHDGDGVPMANVRIFGNDFEA
jgi:hypothetical protein